MSTDDILPGSSPVSMSIDMGEDVNIVEQNIEMILEATGILDELIASSPEVRNIRVIDWWNTNWGVMIRDERVKDSSTYQGKQFRRRFRVPFPFFAEWLVPACTERNIFGSKAKKDGSLCGHIPMEFKLLIGLRILGRGNCADDMAELSGAGESTVNWIFKAFVRGFAAAFREDFIYLAEGDELERVLEVYKRLGFPGACGSMDCTHVKWNRCPVNLSNACRNSCGLTHSQTAS